MSSLLTNASAMTALQTLTQVNKDLSTTQARISTGQKVAKASDNAAYWSIATTMRSDNSALGAVQEALGLGAAKVDTAYAGMEQAIEYIKDIKDKLIAAKEPSADKTKIQGDIAQLQDQLKGIAESASFSGENWLQAEITTASTVIQKSVVSSFVRDSSGNVSVKTVDYNLSASNVLFDTSGNGNGILDKVATANSNKVKLVDVQVTKDVISTKTVTDLEAAGGTLGTLSVDIGGTATDVETYTVGTDTYMRKYDAAGNIEMDAQGNELWARVIVKDTATTDTLELDQIAKLTQANSSINTAGAAMNTTGSTTEFYFYAEDQVTETVKVAGLTAAALESANFDISGRTASDGADTWVKIDPSQDVWVKADTAASATDDLHGVDVDGVNYDVDEANQALPTALAGASLGFSVSDFDLADLQTIGATLGATGTASDQEAAALDFMLEYVDNALDSMTSAAAELGSISSRISMQNDFISKLTDSLDRGIGRLVDADMEEESARLSALQVQQQLGIQALSIANSNAQNILSLFR